MFVVIFLFATIFLVGFCPVEVQTDGDFFRPKPELSGPWVTMTRGEIWPKPILQNSKETFLVLHPKDFKILLNGSSQKCEILLRSIPRFESRIFPGEIPRSSRKNKMIQPLYQCTDQNSGDCDPNFVGVLENLTIYLESDVDCSGFPYLNMDESYQIFVDHSNYEKNAHVSGKTVWGVLRGLESFSHLIYNTKEHGYQYQINSTYVYDAPRFSHRGVMLDTSRHFLSKKVIILNLDLMEMNKFNVFHWHMTDHPSFPYQSFTFPNLSENGAFDPDTHVYSQKDVHQIIDEARLRGIRVIPEFDTPGHTKSWEAGQPGLLTQCEDSQGNPLDVYGPIDPTEQSTYDFLAAFFDEITRVFPDKYIHIGGDEVNEDSCWSQSRKIRSAMESWKIGSFKKLESFFIDNLLSILEKLPVENGNIVWQEVFDNEDKIRPDTIVQVWKDWGVTNWRQEVFKITGSGYQTILSAPWYMNYIKYGSDWTEFYKVEPLSFGGSQEQKDLLIGGEVCLWGEFVNSVNAIPRLWPRASAAGEKLWSKFPNEDDIFLNEELDEVARRLQEHECRMLARGYPVQPVVGAGYCPVHWEF